jgi:hypothetical protein
MLARMLWRGDPLADAVIDECQALGSEARKALDRGIRHGLATLRTPPPRIESFFRQVETLPEWLAPETIKKGGTLFSIHPLWVEMTNLHGMLHTYTAPAIARVLAGTGRLAHDAAQRAHETGLWHLKATLPGSLAMHAPGYVATLQVRLLHARVRRRLLRDWDVGAWGVPLNQVDLARTWLSSVFIPLRALLALGFDITTEEIRAIYKVWEYINHLLGIDPFFYHGIEDQAGAEAMLRLIDTTNGPPDENSRRMTRSLIEVLVGMLMQELKTPLTLTAEMVFALTRFIHGDDVSDALDIAQTEIAHLMPLVIHDNRNSHRLLKLIPGARKKEMAENEALIRAIIAAGGSAEYHGYE